MHPPLARGLLFVFEGIDGAGKTTQASRLASNLRKFGLEVVESKEPTNGPWGTQLRQSAATGRLDAKDELELFVRDRRQHVAELIRPALEQGKIVIVDRYYFSTAAYQGARGLDFQEILDLNEQFAPRPDLLFILGVTPTVGRARIASRGDIANHFEDERSLAAAAAIFARMTGDFIRQIDGTRSADSIEHALMGMANELIDRVTVRPETKVEGLTAATMTTAADAIIGDDSIPAENKAAALLERLHVRS